jgi:hypothetical protein
LPAAGLASRNTRLIGVVFSQQPQVVDQPIKFMLQQKELKAIKLMLAL